MWSFPFLQGEAGPPGLPGPPVSVPGWEREAFPVCKEEMNRKRKGIDALPSLLLACVAPGET